MRSDWHNKVEEVLFKVTEMIRNDGHQQDISYFKFHKDRYQRMALALEPKDEKKKSVLNIGSHYLHSTLIFQLLGFEVDSMDVDVFWNIDFVDARATHYQVNKIIENDLETLMSLKNIHDKYDIVLFTEILEHITFNPIAFWKKIYDSLKTDGIIYISTPNSLNLANVIRATIKIVTLRGIGTPLNEIFSHVTYGHHWKEYSSSEIKRYFSKLSDDFKVSIKKYNYKDHHSDHSLGTVNKVLSFIGGKTVLFADEIEAIVSVEKKGNWKIEPPQY